MAFVAKDGSRHTNIDTMRQADAKHMARMGSGNSAAKPAMMAKSDNDGAEPMDSQSPQDVKAEHGPAVEVKITHDHEAGRHQVHSMHADGHEHMSEHETADEAHDHAKMLGCDDGDGEGY